MPDKVESFKVVCSGGLNSNENHLQLSQDLPGSATRLVNFEVSLYGGYRRVEGFAKYDAYNPEVDPLDAEGAITSITFFRNDSTYATDIIATRGVKKFSFVATAGQTTFTGADIDSRTLDLPFTSSVSVYVNGVRKYLSIDFTATSTSITLNTGLVEGDIVAVDPHEYSFYRYSYSGWQKYTLPSGYRRKSILGINPVKKVRSVTFDFGSGSLAAFVDGANKALVFDGTTWSEISSTGAGTQGDAGGPSALDNPAIVDVFENHLFLSGDVFTDSVIAHSSPLDPFDFSTANGAGQLTMGFPVVQFKGFRDNLFVFAENGIKKVSADLTAGFVSESVTNNVGCIARDSVFEIGGDLIFLAPDGLRPVAGTSRIGDVELETISKSVQQLLKDYSQDYDLDELSGVVVRSKSQIRYFVGGSSVATADSPGIIGGLRSADQRLGWEFGELLGIRASCCASSYVNGQELVLHGDYDGCVYRQETGTTFDGANILSVYSTPFFDFGDTEVRKSVRKINTFIRAEGPIEVNLSIKYDWNDPAVSQPASYTEISAGAPVVYKGRNVSYGGAGILYGGSEKPIMQTSVQGSGYAAQLNFVALGAFEPFSIQGLVIEFSTAGRL